MRPNAYQIRYSPFRKSELAGSRAVVPAVELLRTEQPARDEIDRYPSRAIDAEKDCRQDDHNCKEDCSCRCRNAKQATKEYSFKAIVGCTDAGTHDRADNNGDTKLLEIGPDVGHANACKQFLHDEGCGIAVRGGPDRQHLRWLDFAPR